MIKEYITQNTRQSDDAFKGIYEKLDSQIEKHEKTIEELTQELRNAKKDELPYIQLANEISASYPSVKQIYLSQGAHITMDSLRLAPCIMVRVQTDSLMDSASVSQLKKWIQVRLQVEHVEVDNVTVN